MTQTETIRGNAEFIRGNAETIRGNAETIRGNAWEEALHSHLISHVEQERGLLDAYQNAADESQSSAFRYLVTMIIDEERRHHAMFDELGKTLQTEVERGTEGFAVPRLGHWGFERQRILELTEGFLAEEAKDDETLSELEAELDPVKDTTMWPLLVRLMRVDTSKHRAILEFIKEHVERSWESGQADWSSIEHVASSPPDGSWGQKSPSALPGHYSRPLAVDSPENKIES